MFSFRKYLLIYIVLLDPSVGRKRARIDYNVVIDTEDFIHDISNLEQEVFNSMDLSGMYPTSDEILDALEATQNVSNGYCHWWLTLTIII